MRLVVGEDEKDVWLFLRFLGKQGEAGQRKSKSVRALVLKVILGVRVSKCCGAQWVLFIRTAACRRKWSSFSIFPADKAEARMRGRRVRGVSRPGTHPVAVAIGIVTQKRASFDYFLGTFLWSGRVLCVGRLTPGGMKPVGGPFPDVARGVVQPEAVGRKTFRRSGP